MEDEIIEYGNRPLSSYERDERRFSHGRFRNRCQRRYGAQRHRNGQRIRFTPNKHEGRCIEMAKKELKLRALVSPTETVVVSAYNKEGRAEACTLA